MQRNLNFLDFPVTEIQVWEELQNQTRNLAIEAVARLVAKATFPNPDPEADHE